MSLRVTSAPATRADNSCRPVRPVSVFCRVHRSVPSKLAKTHSRGKSVEAAARASTAVPLEERPCLRRYRGGYRQPSCASLFTDTAAVLCAGCDFSRELRRVHGSTACIRLYRVYGGGGRLKRGTPEPGHPNCWLRSSAYYALLLFLYNSTGTTGCYHLVRSFVPCTAVQVVLLKFSETKDEPVYVNHQ